MFQKSNRAVLIRQSLIFLFFAIIFVFAICGSSYVLYKKQVAGAVRLIESELTNDLISQGQFSAEKRISLLKSMGFSGLYLEMNNESNLNNRSCWQGSRFPIFVDGQLLGVVVDCAKGSTILSFAFRSPLFTLVFVFMVLVLSLVYFLPLIQYKLKVKKFIQNAKQGIEILRNDKFKNDGVISEIYQILNSLAAARVELERNHFQRQQHQALDLMARQVAHDIRSPLSALNMVSSSLKEVPEEKRLLIRNAIQRINDIANDLLAKGKQAIENPDSSLGVTEVEAGASGDASRKLEVILLPALVDSLVSEKRIQFRDQINVHINSDFGHSFGAFVKGDSKELMRLLSNLINNSVEAFTVQKGDVMISVRAYKDTVHLSICDNGRGISPNKLETLGEAGVSWGKEGTQSGSGLGIYHAKKTIESVGGRLVIKSQVGFGTIIDIHLPRVAAPVWFPEVIVIHYGMEILSLDDDLTIHQIWKGRLESLQASQKNVHLRNYTSSKEFDSFVKTLSVKERNTKLFLIDFELLGQSTTGLDLIEQLGLQQNVILVTSRYEEPAIKSRCELLKVKLLPKALAGFVPMELKPDNLKR